MPPPSMKARSGRLVVVSNRLPFRIERVEGRTHIRPGGGGLVTALDAVLRTNRGAWIGWNGGDASVSPAAMADAADDLPYQLIPFSIEPALIEGYYRGFANGTMWPLLHDLLGRARFDREDWEAYQKANRLFAGQVIESTTPDDLVWVQDYHLALLAEEVRRQAKRRLCWFLHTPFPPVDIYANLPWRRSILRGLLHFDLLGFQTRRDMRNFLGCVRALLPDARIAGPGGASRREIHFAGRSTRVGRFPISIDYSEFDGAARTEEVARCADQIHAGLPAGEHVLGVDRLDYTKGIQQRLLAMERLFELYPEHLGQVTLVQIAVPSRVELAEYRSLKRELDREVGRINGRFAEAHWAPIQYFCRNVPREELMGYYRAAEIALVTPLKDGMNLVAKEYCASSVDNRGILILSEFAGAAAQLQGGALLVNPYHTDQVAEALHRSLTMPEEERNERMRRLRRQIRAYDVARWVREYLEAANSTVAVRGRARRTPQDRER